MVMALPSGSNEIATHELTDDTGALVPLNMAKQREGCW